ncbi:mucoidy inhibitor MuiA family protein [Wenjunlia tyrosinilytica]|uniref:Mucoidy inhibitor MuiA family protein n=1 Tax=Wenjunlia tyrosinilytica TaxID=1544741 RepID=A0A917ZN65_9ACTN|nr:mucoidy inhibitor MuiA family protein [Wenjunlia tyrosinilytica]GGO87790.1 hypothetical protein GCM10012280_27070 [Wenjunlia tyrosinilytica]
MTHTTPAEAVTTSSANDDRGSTADEPVELPITAVTCLEDRAQVERRGEVQLAAGVQRLRVGPVTALAVDRSLRVDVAVDGGATGGNEDAGGTDDGDRAGATGGTGAFAKVIDARVVRSYTPAPADGPGPDASAVRREVHALEREIAEVSRLRERLESRLGLIEQAGADLIRDICEGAGAGEADPERWGAGLDRIESRAEPCRDELREVDSRLYESRERLREARQALERTEGEPEELTAVVEVVVEAERAGRAVLRVVHLVPCALWRPAYRATLAPDGRSVGVETDAVVWQRTGEDWPRVRLSLSTARPTLAASPPPLAEDVLVLRDRSAEERRTVEVDLREEEILALAAQSAGAADRRTELPGLEDGGEVRVMAAPVPVSVASDGRPHRIHLSSFTAECRAERTSSPEFSPLVAQEAVVTNECGHVLLAGPVDLVRGSGFVGRGELRFAGPGEEVRLAFGSEDTYRVVRHVEEQRETTGMAGINSRTVITRTVRLFVSRLDVPTEGGTTPVVVRERIPVSEVSAVEIRLKKDACRPEPDSVDAEGIVRYELHLAPGERREIALVHEIVATAAVTGL